MNGPLPLILASASPRRAELMRTIGEGDYFNVVGLPLARVALLLKKVGIPVSNYW